MKLRRSLLIIKDHRTDKHYMKTIILMSLVSLSLSVHAYVITLEDYPAPEIGMNDDLKTKTLSSYCLGGEGEMAELPPAVSHHHKFSCKYGHTEQYFFEAWLSNSSKNFKDGKLIHQNLDPNPVTDPGFPVVAGKYVIARIKKEHPEYAQCPEQNLKDGENQKMILDCPEGQIDIGPMVTKIVSEKDFQPSLVSFIYQNGEAQSKKNNPDLNINQTSNKSITDTNPVIVTGTSSSEVVPGPSVVSTQSPTVIEKKITTDTPSIEETTKPEEKVAVPTDETAKPAEKTTQQTEVASGTEDAACTEALRQAISDLLTDDKKNIIGLQYELTVLKLSALAIGAQTNSLEGLIRKQARQIGQLDNGVIDKMNAMYKAHGLPEDAKAISDNLKLKAKSASYFDKNKRFFNDTSSAFVLAYQQMHKDSGLRESDVSVLWFMDKVSQKAMARSGKFSSAHNRTNLSTRIAQYTGIVNPKLAQSKQSLEDKIKKQKAKIDEEFRALIADFKSTNQACFDKLFADGTDDECNLNVVDTQLSQLLAIHSKIPSTDMISLDDHLKGGIDETRFSIRKYVNSPVSNKGPKKIEQKESTSTQRLPAASPQPGDPDYVDPIDQEDI